MYANKQIINHVIRTEEFFPIKLYVPIEAKFICFLVLNTVQFNRWGHVYFQKNFTAAISQN